ncbi:Retrovirus-related Pol polyprotein from transposon TNT 1-94 [Cardamine amara subsp. amara]|uniref:Retrovirus-related Pol polyprotein from transposon TNT 1-94 n=1 Tax=Cardamine amara subsp. amara TaxID=228776 RepID=A0ABD1C0X0_CARAN
MHDSKKGFMPMLHGITLSKKQCPSTQAERERMNKIPYASAVGSIMYAMLCTRPDVACALSMTSRYQSDPGSDELVVSGFTDASFQTDKDDFRSQSGYVFCLNGSAISWKSSKQSTVADSTIEAEYIAASEAANEAVWIKKFMSELGVIPSIS